MKPALSSKCTESMAEVRVHSSSSNESISNPPMSQETFSAFGDTACGEPLPAQHLMLDFTPIEEVDNDFIQRKCCAFWEYINNRTDLHNLMVLPERNLYDLSRSSEIPPESEKSNGKSSTQLESTAVTMLEFVKEKGLIDRTFEARLPQSHCSLGSREYIDNEPDTRQTHQKQKILCRCKGVCKGYNKPAAIPETSPAVKLCGEMREWDRKHPKCRPICKNRRREWKGKQQNTSAELLLERKPLPECFKRWPKKVFPNGHCPLFTRSRRVTVCPRGEPRAPCTPVVRLCQAPIDDAVETPYLKYSEVAKTLGAWDSVKTCCAFCPCGGCCPCVARRYEPRDAERALRRRSDMRLFDARVKRDCVQMRIMYDKP